VRALEEAPRYRDAHRLLLEIVGRMEGTDPSPAAAAPAPDAPTPPQQQPVTDTEVRQP